MLNIGEASARSGLSASTIRYYEDEGLLTALPQRKAGRRLYDAATLAELSLLHDLRRAGMTLADIRHFQSLRGSSAPCSELSALAAKRAKHLRAEILALRQAESRLNQFAQSCSVNCGTDGAAECSQLGTITKKGAAPFRVAAPDGVHEGLIARG